MLYWNIFLDQMIYKNFWFLSEMHRTIAGPQFATQVLNQTNRLYNATIPLKYKY